MPQPGIPSRSQLVDPEAWMDLPKAQLTPTAPAELLLLHIWQACAAHLTEAQQARLTIAVDRSTQAYCRISRKNGEKALVQLSAGLLMALDIYSRAYTVHHQPRYMRDASSPVETRCTARNVVRSMAQHHRRHGVIEGHVLALTEAGADFASALAATGLCFLVLHELAHLELGHLELQTEHEELASKLAHALEFQADGVAVAELAHWSAAVSDSMSGLEVLFELLTMLMLAVPGETPTHGLPYERYLAIVASQDSVVASAFMRRLRQGARGFWYLQND